jgi:serine/threonine-protein kinase
MAQVSANIDRKVAEVRRDPRVANAPVPSQIIAERYRLVRELARGGMGLVWVAEDLRLEGLVALKFMLGEQPPSAHAERRFAREAKAAVKLAAETDYVVKVIDYGVDRATSYIAMELLSGEDLAARLSRVGRLSPEALCPILRQIASALKKAHRMNLVHRDIKPANIFLVARDEEERVKMLDFGIVKELDPVTITRSSELVGTFCYMSPEQVKGISVDHRTDLWSLAVVLYRGLTGRLPFFEEQPVGSLVLSICHDPIPLPSEVAPDLPSEANAFFARALERRPEKRFQSAAELAGAFAELARVSWPPPSSLTNMAIGSATTLPAPPHSGPAPDAIPDERRALVRGTASQRRSGG